MSFSPPCACTSSAFIRLWMAQSDQEITSCSSPRSEQGVRVLSLTMVSFGATDFCHQARKHKITPILG